MLRSCLQAKYGENDKIKRLFYPEYPLPIASCYLHLALVQNDVAKQQKQKILDESARKNFEQRDYLLHEYERIDHIQRKLELTQLLQECKTPIKRIYIEGAAGAGKSTLAQRIAYDWSQNTAPWDNYKWLFHIRLRDLRNAETTREDYLHTILMDAFRHEDNELENWQLEKIRKKMREQPRQVMFLLDGYDELQINPETLKKLLEPLKAYDFIVTSRPNSNFKEDIAKHYVAVNQIIHLAVLGFNDEQIEKYIHQFFDPKYNKPETKPEEAQICFSNLRGNPNLWSLSHIPIQLELLCSIWSDEIKEQPRLTLTNVYELMLEKLLMRVSMERQGQYAGDLYGYELRKDYNQQIHYLSYLAYLGMLDNKIVLERQSHIEKALQDLKIENTNNLFKEIKALGLFKRTDDGKQGEFLHLTFQEFLAAKYWVTLFENQATQKQASQLLIINRNNPRYQVMWWFAAGLLKEKLALLELFFIFLLLELFCVSLLEKDLQKTSWHRLITMCSNSILLSMRCLEESSKQNELASISQINFLMSIYQSYLEQILLPNIRKLHYYTILNLRKNNNFQLLILTLRKNILLVEKLNLNGLLEKEFERGYQYIQYNILELLKFFKHPTLLIQDKLIKSILKNVQSKNREISRKAVYALLEFGRKDSVLIEVLYQELNATEAIERHRAADQLIAVGEHREAAVVTIVKNLSATEAWIRQFAAEKLIALGEHRDEVVKMLLKDLHTTDVYGRQNAAEQLIELGEHREEAVEMLLKDLSATKAFDRQRAAELLITLGEHREAVLRILLQDLRSTNAGACQGAAELLITLGEHQEEVVATLVENLNAAEAIDRHGAAYRLIVLGKHREAAVATIVKNLSANKAVDCQNAAELLITLGEHREEAIATLIKNLNAAQAVDRHKAAYRLIALGEHRELVVELLLKDLSAVKVDDRQSAAQLLIELGEHREVVVAMLMKDLNIKNNKIRQNTEKLLIELGVDTKTLSEKTEETVRSSSIMVDEITKSSSCYNPPFHSVVLVIRNKDEIVATGSVINTDRSTASSLETLVPVSASSETKKRNAPSILSEIIQPCKKAKYADTSESLAIQEMPANNQATSSNQASSSSSDVLLQPSFVEATPMESEQVELQQAIASSLLDTNAATSRAASSSQSVPTAFFLASTSSSAENEWQKQIQANYAELQARAQLASPTEEEGVFDDAEPISDQSFSDDEYLSAEDLSEASPRSSIR